MKRSVFIFTAVVFLAGSVAARANTVTISLRDFPLPESVVDRYGDPKEMGMIRLMRELHKGGVHGSDKFETADGSYSVVASKSIGLLSAWLEAACKSVGLDLSQARNENYNGLVYARLLTVATGIANSRLEGDSLALPLGVMICQRKHTWGVLPGDGERDAYVLVATERGFLVYDPPTRQCVPLADFPNNSEVLKIQL